MAKIFSADYRSGTFIDSVNKIVGVPTSLSKLIRTEKGTALARVVNHDGVTYTTDSKSLSKFTIVAWIKQRTEDDSDRYGVAYIGSTQIIRRRISSTIYSNYFNSSNQGSILIPITTSLNKWMQFVVTYDGVNVVSSVNNKQIVGSPSATTATLDFTSIIVGRGNFTSRYSDSDILKFDVYDDVISNKEIELDYKALLDTQITEKPVRGFEYPKPTDLSSEIYDNVGENINTTVVTSWTKSGTVVDSGDYVTFSPSTTNFVYKTLGSVNRKYKVSFTARSTVAEAKIRIYQGGSEDATSFTLTTSDTRYSAIVTDASTTVIYIQGVSGSGTVYVKDVIVQELTGLVAAYNMIPNGNTLVDISGNGNNGTILSGNSSREGMVHRIGSGITVKNGALINTLNYTICGRIKLNDLMAGDGVLFSNDDGSGNDIIDTIGFKAGQLSWNYNTAGTLKNGVTNTLAVGIWYDFVFTSNGGRTGTIKAYIDGTEQTITTTAFYRSGTDVRIFNRSNTNVPFIGECSDLRIYNYAFTPEQAKAYHNSFVKPVLLEDFSRNPVNSTLPKGWIAGTGAYKISEIALAQGELIGTDNWNRIPSQVDITDDIITFNGDSEESNINLIKNNFFTLWKKYKIRFRTVSSSTSTGSTFGLRYWKAQTETTKDDSGNSLINEGWHTLEGVYLYAGSGSLRLQISFVNSSDGDLVVIDNVSVIEIPPLPTITTGTKVLECTTAGTAALQSKTAYGEWEFDVFKGADGNNTTIPFISDRANATLDGANGYNFRVNSNEQVVLDLNNDGSHTAKIVTAASYIANNTDYRIKVARLKSEGVFKDIPTLQTSDIVNGTSYPYESFTAKGKYGFSASTTTNGIFLASTGAINININAKYLVEFDLKLNSGTAPSIRIMEQLASGTISNTVVTTNGRNSIILTATSTTTGVLEFFNTTATDYEVSGLTIRRIYPANSFAVFIKGGAYDNTETGWTLVDTTGGSGSNPVVDSTYTTSEYFVTDLDAGDKIGNISILNGVKV